ncbi:conjugal transfer protein TraH, partial [Vibrio owensii]|uniref:conjugal transfer protein TraH n=1 Tax=Vibrio owensii TaxID=696485 RepID=UPI003CC7F78F
MSSAASDVYKRQASYRVKGVRANVVNFQPPKISGGCGGIDFFAGSFSLINSDQLVQMGRAIAQGVPSYAFNLALTSVCPSCLSLIHISEPTRRL